MSFRSFILQARRRQSPLTLIHTTFPSRCISISTHSGSVRSRKCPRISLSRCMSERHILVADLAVAVSWLIVTSLSFDHPANDIFPGSERSKLFAALIQPLGNHADTLEPWGTPDIVILLFLVGCQTPFPSKPGKGFPARTSRCLYDSTDLTACLHASRFERHDSLGPGLTVRQISHQEMIRSIYEHHPVGQGQDASLVRLGFLDNRVIGIICPVQPAALFALPPH